ncbi:hypothetical protein D9M72_572790 [compost metagenome]
MAVQRTPPADEIASTIGRGRTIVIGNALMRSARKLASLRATSGTISRSSADLTPSNPAPLRRRLEKLILPSWRARSLANRSIVRPGARSIVKVAEPWVCRRSRNCAACA